MLGSQFSVYPQAAQFIKEKIGGTRTMIKYRRRQLEQAQKVVTKTYSKNKEEVLLKMATHLDKLQHYFEQFRKRKEDIVRNAF